MSLTSVTLDITCDTQRSKKYLQSKTKKEPHLSCSSASFLLCASFNVNPYISSRFGSETVIFLFGMPALSSRSVSFSFNILLKTFNITCILLMSVRAAIAAHATPSFFDIKKAGKHFLTSNTIYQETSFWGKQQNIYMCIYKNLSD